MLDNKNISACGIDFGTSNSTIGISTNNNTKLIHLEENSPILKSSIFFSTDDNAYYIGQNGINRYFDGYPGRLMLSLKSILGSYLAQEKIVVCKKSLSYVEIIGLVLKYIKTTAENSLHTELNKVILGRPVRYHDHDDTKDRLAQATMQEIALAQGFKEVAFQFEPIAAALDYESTITSEEIALIVDIGGGTSDFTIIKINDKRKTNDRKEDILANYGVHIGGTDFDSELSLHSVMPLLGKGSLMKSDNGSYIEVPSSIYYDLTTWHLLSFLYSHKTINNLKQVYAAATDKKLIQRALEVLQKRLGHYLLNTVEKAKISLSQQKNINVDLSIIEKNLDLNITREQFEISCFTLITQLESTINSTLNQANIKANDINSVFVTGGTTQIPSVYNCIKTLFPNAKYVTGDIFGSVGKGLAIQAQRTWGNC